MRAIKVLGIIAATISLKCFAGIEHGNGGGAVVCRDTDHKITSIELLDFYEQRIHFKLQRDLGAANLNWLQKASTIFL